MSKVTRYSIPDPRATRSGGADFCRTIYVLSCPSSTGQRGDDVPREDVAVEGARQRLHLLRTMNDQVKLLGLTSVSAARRRRRAASPPLTGH